MQRIIFIQVIIIIVKASLIINQHLIKICYAKFIKSQSVANEPDDHSRATKLPAIVY